MKGKKLTVTLILAVICCNFAYCQTRNYIADNEKDLTKEEVIKRLGQPDKYKFEIYHEIGGDEKYDYFDYGKEFFTIMNGKIIEIYLLTTKCRMLVGLVDDGITVGDNISKLLVKLKNIKYKKEESESESGEKEYIYNILFDDYFRCTTDISGNITSMYYIARTD